MADLPVDIALAKKHLRIDADENAENDLIEGYIAAAVEWIEGYTGLILTPRTVIETFDAFAPRIRLRAWPIVSIDGVSWLDRSGIEQDIPVDGHRLSAGRRPATLSAAAGTAWPCSIAADGGAVEIEMSAGFATPEDVPRAVVQAILLLVAHSYAFREPVAERTSSEELPFGVSALLRRWRVRTL